MILRIFPTLLGVFLAAPAFSQQVNIPPAVIAQCNEQASASDLPTCLKVGTVAFEMLSMASGEDFYGEAAEPVIAVCSETNDTFAGRWTCFRIAAQKAAETRALIGLESIADRCVAGISDPEVSGRIEALFKERRAAMFPDQSYFGGEMYYAFQGCPDPEPAQKQGTGPGSTHDDVASALQTALGQKGEEDDLYSEQSCSLYDEMSELVATSDADELRAISSRVKALEDPDASAMAAATGLSKDAMAFLMSADQRQKITAASTLGSFLEIHHPELMEEFMSQEPARNEHGQPGSDLGNEMARAVMTRILQTAREKYERNCSTN